jgi:hypothetical protein
MGKIIQLTGIFLAINLLVIHSLVAQVVTGNTYPLTFWENKIDENALKVTGMSRVEKENRFGYINSEGKLVIPLIYQSASDFSGGLAAVSQDHKYGYINDSGNYVIPPQYASAFSFSEGWGIVKLGSVTTDLKKKTAGKTVARNAEISDSVGQYAFIDKNGMLMKNKQNQTWFFTDARYFKEGKAAVCYGKFWFYINTSGEIILPANLANHVNTISLKDNISTYINESTCYLDAYTFSEGLAAIKTSRNWGFINATGAEQVVCEYERVDDFHEGFAGVKKNGKWGHIDKKGAIVTNLDYDWVYRFSEGMAVVKLGKKFGFVDNTGNLVIDCRYDLAAGFANGESLVKIAGKESYINPKGECVRNCANYEDANSPNYWEFAYKNCIYGRRGVAKNGKWGFTGCDGKIVIPLEYDNVNEFDSIVGLAVVKKGGKSGLINANGAMVAPIRYDAIKPFQNGYACFNENGKWGILNISGSVVIKALYDKLSEYSDGLMAATKNGLSGYIDTSGSEKIPFVYELAEPFNNGVAMVSKDNKFGFINKKNVAVVPFKFTNIYPSKTHVAKTENGLNKQGYINKYTGKEIIPCVYSYVGDFKDEIAIVKQNGKSGLFHISGKAIVPCVYDNVDEVNKGFAIITKDGKKGVVNKTGKLILPCKYDDVNISPKSGKITASIGKQEFKFGIDGKVLK